MRKIILEIIVLLWKALKVVLWKWLRPVVEYVKKSGDEDFLLNKLIQISGVGRFEIRDMPEP